MLSSHVRNAPLAAVRPKKAACRVGISGLMRCNKHVGVAPSACSQS
jgi:hypothetical protein